jgi:hypothetical protein
MIYKIYFCILFACIFIRSQPLTNTFDKNTGENEYATLDTGNWVSGEDVGISPNCGEEIFASGNGNQSIIFYNLGITKNLGGKIRLEQYYVSFYLCTYLKLEGIAFSDFKRLKIDGAGSTIWMDTIAPTNDGEWVQWRGIYTAAAADTGKTFRLVLLFDLPGRHAIAIDGPITIEKLATNNKRMEKSKFVNSSITKRNKYGKMIVVYPNSPFTFNNAAVVNLLGRKNSSKPYNRFAKGLFIYQENCAIPDINKK